MKAKDIIVLNLNDKKYEVDKYKICYVLSRLSGKNISKDDISEIEKLIYAYGLDKKDILEYINEI